MSVNATAAWRIRVDGDDTNGAGFDSAISGAGTDYTDQASPQLSLSDLATPGAASTTLTSATGGFTAAMIGNCIRISSGTNFTAGYYFITGYTDTNTVTLDRTPTSAGAGSSGVGKLGGAWASLGAMATGGTRTVPSVTSPLVAGNTIYIRGSGSDDPGVTPDYDYSGSLGYWTYPAGNTTGGHIKLVGYNGRPAIKTPGLLMYNAVSWGAENLLCIAGGTNNSTGWAGSGRWSLYNVMMDQNNFDVPMNSGIFEMVECCVRCTGQTTAGSNYAIVATNYNALVQHNKITSKGHGITSSYMGAIIENIITGCGGIGIEFGPSSDNYGVQILRNIIHANGSHGIVLSNANAVNTTRARHNILTANVGRGISLPSGTALNHRIARKPQIDWNAFGAGTFANVSGKYNNFNGGANDIDLVSDVSPFVDEGADDFNIDTASSSGALLVAAALAVPG